jgi:sigma-54 dependent transcriptional regulator, acetoin dehydrogenase operon transcriptional activator AcoR
MRGGSKMQDSDVRDQWEQFAARGRDIQPGRVRPVVLESWKRSRAFHADPFRDHAGKVDEAELARRRARRADLREVALLYIENLFRIVAGTGSLISLGDEDSVILDLETDESIRATNNFPHPGTIHSEAAVGTSGMGTAIMIDLPVQIHAAEHWLQCNHCWACSSVPIHHGGKIIGCLTLSCPTVHAHEHSMGLVVAAVKAIERELDLTETLKEKQLLVKQQNAILELVEAGIALIDSGGRILCANKELNDILGWTGGCIGRHIGELIRSDIDFAGLIARDASLTDHEISLRLDDKHTHLRVSTALIKDGEAAASMVIRVRESRDVLRLVNRVAGSKATYTFADILGKSPALLQCIKLAQNASRGNASVLILGESGTGKELFAQAVHNSSPRRAGPFVAINCGALSRELIQSELFGYEGGAFTGAKKEGNPGRFELADGGTLFLDEIGELPLEAQVNLLRVLQTGEVYRISAKYAKPIDVRLVAATNKDLYSAVKEKTFRDDLFYRINIFSIALPALRDRPEDIRMLADTMLERYSRASPQKFQGFTEEVYVVFERHTWPGNIRELENVVDRAVAIAETAWITMADLPAYLQKTPLAPSQATRAPSGGEARSLKELEFEQLNRLLRDTGGNLREVARRLGIARSTVYNKVRDYRIPVGSFRGPSS